MNTPHQNTPTPSVPEHQEKSYAIKEQAIHALLDRGIDTLLNTTTKGIDPRQFDMLKRDKDEIEKRVRSNMLSIRAKSDSEFGFLTHDEINNFPKKEIWRMFGQKTDNLRAVRSKIESRSKRYFKDINTVIPGFSSTDDKLRLIREENLSEAIENRKTLKAFLVNTYGLNPDALEDADRMNLPAIFHDLPDGTLKDRLNTEYTQYERIGSGITAGTIEKLLKHYTSKRRQREILEAFELEFTIQELLDSGLWNHADLESYVQNEFSDIWADLDRNNQEDLIRSISETDRRIPLQHIDEARINIDTLLPSLDASLRDTIAYLRSEKNKDPILSNIQGHTDAEGNILMHDTVLDQAKKLRSNGGKPPLEGLEKLKEPHSVLAFQSEGKTFMIEILEKDIDLGEAKQGVRYRYIIIQNGRISQGATPTDMDYSDFGALLYSINGEQKIMDANEFESHITDDDNLRDMSNADIFTNPDIKWSRTIDDVVGSIEWLKKELDLIDPEGASYGYDGGVNFISTGTSKKGKQSETSFTILTLNDDGVTVWNGIEKEVYPLTTFLSTVRQLGFRRNSKIQSDADIVKAFQNFGVDGDASLVNGVLTVKKHDLDDHHGHDDHGHGTSEKEMPYHFFKNATDGSHIRVYSIDKNFVTFGEYSSETSVENIQKYIKAKGMSEKKRKKLYHIQSVPLGYFLEYLKKNKLNATTEDILEPEKYEGVDPHLHGSVTKRLMNSWSINDIIHGFKGVMHGVEHYLEKGSKLNASRAALRMGKALHLPADVLAQLQADEVHNIKEIVEKIKEKLRNLNGPVARLKVMHIIENRDSRPEEVAAATLYMIESYGHLYAEDIKTAQGGEHFLNALIHACGYTSKADRDEQKEKARKKFVSDIGTEPGQQITEEEMIWGFMKGMDGNAEKNPMAGTLIKAMGGPSAWEKAFRKEGFEGAKDKGIRQTSDLVNAQGRLNKFKSALATNEIITAFGMMTTIPGKNPMPELQSAPIMWALFGITGYGSTKLSQEIFQLAAAKGHSFHAYAFLRNQEENALYSDTFFAALEGIASSGEISKLKNSIQAMHFHGHPLEGDAEDKNNKARLSAINYVESLWAKYQDRGLHARLQGMDHKWFLEQMHEKHNGQVQKYFKKISGLHKESGMSGDAPVHDDNGWSDMYGYTGSPILHITDDNLNSGKFMLNKLKVNGSTNYSLADQQESRFWKPFVKSVKELRTADISDELRRKQYGQYRRDVLHQMREFFNARTRESAGQRDIDDAVQKILSNQYGRDIENIGIDLSQIFQTNYAEWSESDYQNFLTGGSRTVMIPGSNASRTQDEHHQKIINTITTTKNDPTYGSLRETA